jgi:dTMP kinase
MVACNLGRAAVTALLPFVDTVFGLVIASFVLEIGALLFSPAKEASVPNLVPTERLASANSLSLAAAYGTFPLAAALFALLAKVGEIDLIDTLDVNQESLAFYAQSITFIVSAIMIWTLDLPDQRRERPAATNGGRVDWNQTVHDIKEGWRYVFINPLVRSVNLGLATGLVGGGMVVPLGSVFSIVVLGAGPAGYGVFITVMGFGVALGVIGVSVTQRRLPKARVFSLSLMVAGISLIAAASTSSLAPAALLVGVMGICAGAVYVLGFTLLHESVEDEIRGRVFSALYTLVRLCLLIAFAIGPFLSELLNGLSQRFLEDSSIEVVDVRVYLPGVRLTLWLAGVIILIAGFLASRSLRSVPDHAAGDPAEQADRVDADTADTAGRSASEHSRSTS